MADGKRRKRSAISISETTIGDPLLNYAEVVFYECLIACLHTANIQVLFSVEDIERRMPANSFMKGYNEAKKIGLSWVQASIAKWLEKQTSDIQRFFERDDFSLAENVQLQRGQITVKVKEKAHKLTVSGACAEQIDAAINLLRYPLAVMEKLQRGKSGDLLCIENDEKFILQAEIDLPLSAQLLARYEDCLNP